MNLLCIIYFLIPNTLNIKSSLRQSYHGKDEHFVEDNNSEYELAFKISKNMDILKKVQYLEKKRKISEFDINTLEILHDYFNYSEIKSIDIRAGGLFNDWNYEVE